MSICMSAMVEVEVVFVQYSNMPRGWQVVRVMVREPYLYIVGNIGTAVISGKRVNLVRA